VTFSQFQIFLAAVLGLLVAIPLVLSWRILRRRGRRAWPALLLVVPGINLVALYAMAYGRRTRD
jgi:hypothetical protein